MSRISSYFTLLLLFLTSCSINPATGKHEVVAMTQTQEYAIARSVKSKLMKTTRLYPDKKTQKYFSKIAKKVYKVGERPENKFNFYLTDHDISNAYALPGYVFLERGLLPFLMDEAALAGILGHEAGHINARHMVQGHVKYKMAQTFLSYINKIGFATSFNDQAADATLKHFGRAQELEADALAIRYLEKLEIPAGNTALTFKAFDELGKIANKKANLNEHLKKPIKMLNPYLRTHPSSEKRIKKIEEMTDTWSDYIKLYRQKEYYAKIDGMVYGYSPYSRDYRIGVVNNTPYIASNNNSQVYGYKNNLYLKNYSYKVVLPEGYQAKVHENDPMAYNYKKAIKLDVFKVRDDKDRYALDVILDMLGYSELGRNEIKIRDVDGQENSFDSTRELMKESEFDYFSIKTKQTLFEKLFNQNVQYNSILIKRLNKKSIDDDYQNRFLVFVLSSKYKKAFEEYMKDDILSISENITKLTKKQKDKIKPLSIKIIKADGKKGIKDYSQEYSPYVDFSEDWFKAMNALYDEYSDSIPKDTLLKLIVNNNKNI